MTALPEIIIRPFQSDDAAMVDEFFHQMGEETTYFFNQGDGNHIGTMKFFTEPTPNHAYFAATETIDGAERMVGYVFLWDIHRPIPWLGIAVRDCYKGIGIGTRLMKHAREYAIAHGNAGILLTTAQDNLRGQALYQKSGYEQLGIQTTGRQEFIYLLQF